MDERFTRFINTVLTTLERRGHTLAPGLSDSEVERAENRFGFKFPPDLKQFLQTMLPIFDEPHPPEIIVAHKLPWPDWRNGPEEDLVRRFSRVVDAFCFDIENNDYWHPAWGEKPERILEAFEIARAELEKVPRLIPIFGHRYIPDEPLLVGNPVFSMWQAVDTIYYGWNLVFYFHNEFGVPLPNWAAPTPREIRFWSEIVS